MPRYCFITNEASYPNIRVQLVFKPLAVWILLVGDDYNVYFWSD